MGGLAAGPARALRSGLLLPGLMLAGCANLNPFGGGSAVSPPPTAVQPEAAPAAAAALPPAVPGQTTGPGVGLLLPLSGPNGRLGATMLDAAKLALAGLGSPRVDAHDTAGAGGAAQAARLAVQNGDPIILGPLTSSDTAEVAPVAAASQAPVLAFTSDVAQARPGVWVMGITPEQQVRRLVFAAKAEGRSRIAALLPSNGLGDALASSLTQACIEAGLAPPTILTHVETRDSIDATTRQISDTATREATVDQQATTAPAPAAASSAPVAAPPAAGLPLALAPAPSRPAGGGGGPLASNAAGPAVVTPPRPLPPPPFDALLLGDTGTQLQEVIEALKLAGVTSPQVRIMGPGLWGAFAGKLRALAGAWYAAPDPSARRGFVERYEAAHHGPPKPLDDFAYDAGALARSLAAGGYSVPALTTTAGFAGVDGLFTLKPDGHVYRSLAIFQIQPGGGGVLVQPAPPSPADTGI